MERLRSRGVAVLAAVLVLSFVACSSNDGGNDGGSSGGGEGPLTIGASLPLTGDFSVPGTEAQRGYQVWQEMVNAAGGLLGRQVEFKIVDDASDQDTVVSDYEKLISQDKVDLLLGTFSSLLNLPASAVAERHQMVYVEPAGGNPDIFAQGYQYVFFSQQALASHQGDRFVDYILSLPEDQRPKTAAYPSLDDPFAAPVVGGIKEKLEPAGIQTAYETVFPEGTTNLDTVAAAIKSSGAELVAAGSQFEDGVALIRSLIKVGYSPKFLFQTNAPSFAGQFSDGIGKGNTEGIFYAVSWSPEADYPLNPDFVTAYKAKFNAEPSEDAADAFAAAQVLQAAVEAVGSLDQPAIKDWLHANSVPTILGELSWDETGAPEQAFLLAQWQSGTSEIVSPAEVATSDTVVAPKPDWAG
jgi:ABC-type branched-subunit amino acid transport system substrate-binding protein